MVIYLIIKRKWYKYIYSGGNKIIEKYISIKDIYIINIIKIYDTQYLAYQYLKTSAEGG